MHNNPDRLFIISINVTQKKQSAYVFRTKKNIVFDDFEWDIMRKKGLKTYSFI